MAYKHGTSQCDFYNWQRTTGHMTKGEWLAVALLTAVFFYGLA